MLHRAFATAIAIMPTIATANTFTAEVIDASGGVVAVLQADDPLFSVDVFEADRMQVQGETLTLRWSGEFDSETSSDATAMPPDHTFAAFTLPDGTYVLCRPAAEGATNLWQRMDFTDSSAMGQFVIELVSCGDLDGQDVAMDGLPLRVQGNYRLAPSQ